MNIRRFQADRLQDALDAVRERIGPEAVILETRRVRGPGPLGYLRPRRFEVVAAAEERASDAIRGEILGLRAAVERMARRLDSARGPGESVVELLDARGVPRQEAMELVADLEPPAAPADRRAIGARMESIMGFPHPIVLEPGTRKVCALVGPTGVGKTTTLAKLAARFALMQRARVCLVTADTYRIAAIEQLRTYGQILGVPVEVAVTPAEVEQALARHAQADLVLVDTAGRSPRNEMQMAELKNYLRAVGPGETHLVLGLNMHAHDAMFTARAFAEVGFDHFLFTKLDETRGPGLILPLRRAFDRPLSYITTGQRVPEDIEVANAQRISRMLLEAD